MAPPDFVEQDWGASGVVSFPEFFPLVGVGQVFPPSPSGEIVDDKQTIGPNEKLLRSTSQSVQIKTCCVALLHNRRASTAARSSALATD